jgi:hypothetical protein
VPWLVPRPSRDVRVGAQIRIGSWRPLTVVFGGPSFMAVSLRSTGIVNELRASVECPKLAGDCLTTIGGADPQVTDARLQAVAEAR